MRGDRWSVPVAGLIVGAALTTSIMAADEPKPETTTDASQGFVTFKSGDNALTFGAWGQFRATIDDKDEFDNDTAGTGVGTADGTSVSFAIVRLRPYLQGTVYKPWFKYKFEFALGPLKTDATNNIGNTRLSDGYIELAPVPEAVVRVGQFKVPFGMQQLTSDTRQEFVDRSIADAKFAPTRDVGLMLHGTAWEKKFGYQAGIFNGSGPNNPQEDRKQMYAARVWIDPLGEYKLSESANDASDKNLLHLGLGYRGGEVMRGTATAGVFEDADDETAANLEVAWRWRRLFAMGEYFTQTDEMSNPTAGADVEARGWHAQFGVMVQQKQHELALRYAEVEPDKSVADAKQTEARLVYGYYIKGHNLKIQTDIGTIDYGKNFSTLSSLALRNVSPGLEVGKRLATVTLPGTDIKDKQARIQLTVSF